jgi:type VI secretion system ImpC/EvpB family protein
VLLGDYEIRPLPSREHPIDDVSALSAVSQVAAAAFAPFIAAVHPTMFELEDFVALQQPLNHAATFEQLEYLKWRAFRESEDSRFVALTLPRVLMRLPYQDDGSRRDRFRFHEDTTSRDASKYLWGNAAFALGAVLIRTFKESGWLADIRGVQRGVDGGGLVPGLPVASAATDRPGLVLTGSTEVVIADRLEPELSELGFITLCRCQDTEYSAIYGTPTVQKPKKYDDPAATANARISSMLQYMLCTSRFAHYLKVAARDKIGSFVEPDECEHYLHDWLQGYVTADAEASAETKAQYPLRQADVRVRQHPDRPGSYLCVIQLWPHFQLDELTTSVRLATELSSKRPE